MSIFDKVPIPGQHGGPHVPGVDIEGQVRDAMQAALKPALAELQQQGKDRLYDITYNGNNYLGAIRKEGEAIKGAIPNEVKQAIEDGLQAALREFFEIAGSGFLDKYVAILDAAAPDGAWPTIGPVALAIGDLRGKLDKLKHWARHPPHNRETLKLMIVDLAPDQVWVTITVSVPFTDSLKAGGQLFWTAENFLDRLDDLAGELSL